jgi:uncharacterized protein
MTRTSWLVSGLVGLLANAVLADNPGTINVAAIEAHLGTQVTPADSTSLRSQLLDYTSRATPKAVAVASNRDGRAVSGVSATGGTRGLAASSALAACETARQPLASVLINPCELILQGNEWVGTHAHLTRGITPDSAASVWRVRGSAGVVYLAGSVHVLTPSFYPLPPAFEHAFSKADRLVLELNPLLSMQPDRMAVMQAAMLASPDNVSHALGAPLRSRLAEYLGDQGMPLDAVLRFQPAILSTQLSIQEMAAYGYAPQHGVDIHYAQRATQQGMPILELETIESQMQALTGMPLEVQAKLLEQTLDQMASAQAAVTDLVTSWLTGNADHLHALMVEEFQGSPVMETLGRRLIDERNIKMVAQIRAFLSEPSTTLVIVGAGHYGGGPGIVNLLRTAGFGVEQLTQAGTLVRDGQTPAVPGPLTNQGNRS